MGSGWRQGARKIQKMATAAKKSSGLPLFPPIVIEKVAIDRQFGGQNGTKIDKKSM